MLQEYRAGAYLVKPDESRVSVEDKVALTDKSSSRTKERKDKYCRRERILAEEGFKTAPESRRSSDGV